LKNCVKEITYRIGSSNPKEQWAGILTCNALITSLLGAEFKEIGTTLYNNIMAILIEWWEALKTALKQGSEGTENKLFLFTNLFKSYSKLLTKAVKLECIVLSSVMILPNKINADLVPSVASLSDQLTLTQDALINPPLLLPTLSEVINFMNKILEAYVKAKISDKQCLEMIGNYSGLLRIVFIKVSQLLDIGDCIVLRDQVGAKLT
jgi:hypothetical protein